MSDGSFNYLNDPLEGVVPRRGYANGQLTYVAHALSLVLVDGLTAVVCAVPYALLVGSLVGITGVLLTRYVAIATMTFYLINTIQECISFCIGAGHDHDVPMLMATIMLTASNGILLSPRTVPDWMKPFYLANPSFWVNVAINRAIVSDMDSPRDPHDDVYDYLMTNGASIATAWGTYGDDLFGVTLTFEKALVIIVAYGFAVRALGVGWFMRGGKFRSHRKFVPGGGAATPSQEEWEATGETLAGIADAADAAEHAPVADLYATLRSSPATTFYERSLDWASKRGLAHVTVVYLDAVFRVSRALIRVPLGVDAGLTVALIVAYAVLVERFVAIHGLLRGAHRAGFDEEPALRPRFYGLASALAATAAAAVATAALCVAVPAGGGAHGLSAAALVLRVAETSLLKEIQGLVRHALALGCHRSHREIHQHVFDFFDRNGDGFISRNELRASFVSLRKQLTEAELTDAIERVDADANNKIDFEEFLSVVLPQNAADDEFLTECG